MRRVLIPLWDGMSRNRTLRVTVVTVLALALGSLLLVEGVYQIGSASLPPLPKPPALVPTSLIATQAIWASLSGEGPVEITPIMPWRIGAVLQEMPLCSLARHILSDRRLFPERMNESKREWKTLLLMIWLSRHWSTGSVMKVLEERLYFGRGIYGLETASMKLIGKRGEALTGPEAATLAALTISPSDNADANALRRRRNRILRRMCSNRAITATEYAAAASRPITLAPGGGR